MQPLRNVSIVWTPIKNSFRSHSSQAGHQYTNLSFNQKIILSFYLGNIAGGACKGFSKGTCNYLEATEDTKYKGLAAYNYIVPAMLIEMGKAATCGLYYLVKGLKKIDPS